MVEVGPAPDQQYDPGEQTQRAKYEGQYQQGSKAVFEQGQQFSHYVKIRSAGNDTRSDVPV